jgi:hypothetical protein
MLSNSSEGTRTVALEIKVPARFDNVDAWLKESHTWSFVDWLTYHVENMLENCINLDDMLAEDLAELEGLPKEEELLVRNEARRVIYDKAFEADQYNRIFYVDEYGKCPNCHTANAYLVDVMEDGKIILHGCDACVDKQSYVSKWIAKWHVKTG